MSLIVQKYGGTSVADVERIRNVARRVTGCRRRGDDLVVVVSAMAGETNRLLALAKDTCPEPDRRESDVLVSTGEQVTTALLAMALTHAGCPALSLQGHQIRIVTDQAYTKARIRSIDDARIRAELAAGRVVVVAGFQGVDEDDNITTLGRGGSDTSAVALAAALEADSCEIYTDVDGVYTSDPRIVPNARKLDRISYDEMLELASQGAKVLQIRSVEFAKRYAVPVQVRSSFTDTEGTWVVAEEASMEDVLVSGVTSDSNEAKITLVGVPDQPGLAARVFGPIADANIVVDMIIQNASAAERTTDLTFTVPKADFAQAMDLVRKLQREIGAKDVRSDENIAKVSIVGLGMRSHAGVAAKMFRTLAEVNINIQMIATSEIKTSIVVDAKFVELAVRVLHDAFIGGGRSSA
jgi:aspartate kinase